MVSWTTNVWKKGHNEAFLTVATSYNWKLWTGGNNDQRSILLQCRGLCKFQEIHLSRWWKQAWSDHEWQKVQMCMIRVHSVHSIHSLRKSKRSWLHTAISRKVVGKNVHATIPKGSVGGFEMIISHITFWNCRMLIFSDNLSRNSCICCTCKIATWRLGLRAPLVACYDNFEFWRQKLHVASKPDKSSSSSERGSCISVNKCSSAYLLK